LTLTFFLILILFLLSTLNEQTTGSINIPMHYQN